MTVGHPNVKRQKIPTSVVQTTSLLCIQYQSGDVSVRFHLNKNEYWFLYTININRMGQSVETARDRTHAAQKKKPRKLKGALF